MKRSAFWRAHSLINGPRSAGDNFGPGILCKVFACALVCLCSTFRAAYAVDLVDMVRPASLDQPQINVVLRQASDNSVIVGSTPDILGGDPTINLTAYLDTGASGILLNNTVKIPTSQGGWGLQMATYNNQPVVFTDVGVVASDDFSVSQPVNIGFAPYHPTVTNAVGPTNTASFYTQQINSVRAQVGPVSNAADTPIEGLDLQFLLDELNVVGMPALKNKVMVVDARSSNQTAVALQALNGSDPSTLALGLLSNDFSLRTYIYDKNTPFKTSDSASIDPGVPNTNLHVKLSYGSFDRFTTTSPLGALGPSLEHNPFLGPDPTRALAADPNSLPPDNTPKVKIGLGGLTTEGSFLLDTGAGASFVSKNIAAQLHVRYVAGGDPDSPKLEYFTPTPDPNDAATAGQSLGLVPNQFQLSVGGIGGTATVAGFYLDSMLIRTQEGNPAYDNDPRHLRFVGAPVLVTDITVKDPNSPDPAHPLTLTLDGDLGMNFLVASLDFSSDPTSPLGFNFGNFTPGAFDWLTYDEAAGTLGLKLNSAFHMKGDFNLDGYINNADIQAMLSAVANVNAYQTANSLSSADLLTVADINGDGVVNNADISPFMQFLAGASLPGSIVGVPEPASVALMLLGAVGLALQYRRRSKLGRES